jgi:hypothetical protein
MIEIPIRNLESSKRTDSQALESISIASKAWLKLLHNSQGIHIDVGVLYRGSHTANRGSGRNKTMSQNNCLEKPNTRHEFAAIEVRSAIRSAVLDLCIVNTLTSNMSVQLETSE